MTEYVVIIGAGIDNPDDFDLSRLEEWDAVLASDLELGGKEIIFSTQADSLVEAARAALVMVEKIGVPAFSLMIEEESDAQARIEARMGETVGVAEAARILGISGRAVTKRIAVGNLGARREGGTWRIPRAALNRAAARWQRS